MKNIFSLNIYNKNLSITLTAKLLKKFGKNSPTIVCLGSDKVLSDMVGVLVADELKKHNIQTNIYGGSDFIVTTKNLDNLLSKISSNNILFVDSCITKTKDTIYFSNSGIQLKNNKFYCGASICAGTIFLSNNKISLADINYKQIKYIANNIVFAIKDYFCLVT